MTDRELLELAAKACGFEYECTSHTGRPEDDQHQIRSSNGSLIDWNPLNDDGDALRLAVSLYSRGFMLEAGSGGVTVTVYHPVIMSDEWCPSEGTFNPDAATRRAIVRAAAEIGKAMTC